MKSKKVLGVIAAVGLLGGSSAASAQTPGVWTPCAFQWCANQVAVGPSGGTLEWKEIRMAKGANSTIVWILFGGPDDELRADSVVFTGDNAKSAATQFPLRQITPTRVALDNLNTSGLTYPYDLRVYKKGSAPGAASVTVKGAIVNAPN